jgi:hypothetical protein
MGVFCIFMKNFQVLSKIHSLLLHYIGVSPNLFWVLLKIRSFLISIGAPIVKIGYKKNKHPPFLFIVGAGRSGNTLLRRLLMEKCNIFIPPETYVLARIVELEIRTRSLEWEAFVNLVVSTFEYHPEFETFNVSGLREYAIAAKKWPKKKQTVSNLIWNLYFWLSVQDNIACTWVGDKTPLNTLYLGMIDMILPHAHYIYIVRDGIDVSVSYVDAGIYKDIKEAAYRWLNSQKCWDAFKKKIYKKKYIEIRYEQLVQHPEDTLENIISAFNLPRRKTELDIAHCLGDVTIRHHHRNVILQPNCDSIGKGRQKLTKEERDSLGKILNTVLSRLGYEKVEC